MKRYFSKTNIQITIGLLSLVCLLSYTWTHTGGLLAEYVKPALRRLYRGAGQLNSRSSACHCGSAS